MIPGDWAFVTNSKANICSNMKLSVLEAEPDYQINTTSSSRLEP